MNLTLSIDAKTLEGARRTAASMGLSVNEMVRRYLEKLAGEADTAGTFRELQELFLTRGGHSMGQAWSREDLHRE